jgi:hypothetical protein
MVRVGTTGTVCYAIQRNSGWRLLRRNSEVEAVTTTSDARSTATTMMYQHRMHVCCRMVRASGGVYRSDSYRGFRLKKEKKGTRVDSFVVLRVVS